MLVSISEANAIVVFLSFIVTNKFFMILPYFSKKILVELSFYKINDFFQLTTKNQECISTSSALQH